MKNNAISIIYSIVMTYLDASDEQLGDLRPALERTAANWEKQYVANEMEDEDLVYIDQIDIMNSLICCCSAYFGGSITDRDVMYDLRDAIRKLLPELPSIAYKSNEQHKDLI